MGKEMRTFDRALLESALNALSHSTEMRSGQVCYLEDDEWHELRSFLGANLRGESFYLPGPDKP